MSVEKRTPAAWTEYLSQEHNPVTLNEYMAGCLSRILAGMIETAQATAHTEGMLGAIDQFAEQIAERSGIPYAGDGAVRAALDARRDQQRRLGQGAQPRD